MRYKIVITPTAINDVEQAVDYYNSKANLLGQKFLTDLDNNLNSISKNPEAFAKRYKEIRGKNLKVFPFIILYLANKKLNRIEVLRIFNTYQKPFWE